jgi:hypothetical protein
MSKNQPLKSNNLDMKKMYIVTRPTRLSDLQADEYDDNTDYSWRDKSRRLQARRWRAIKNQLA